MKRRITAIAAIALASIASAWAQQSPPPSSSTPPAAVSQEELDKLLAPIALYPDPLLAQVLMASTYPLELVMAARWSKEHPNVTGKALEDAMQKQTWDPSVKGLTAVPKVLERMNENLGWSQKLGDAFLADQPAVMATVQALRAKAQAQGNLKTTPEQTVKTQTQENKTVIVIEPAQPEKIYVPTYDPYYAYGPWWYSYPPYYMYPYGYYYAPGVAFATGILVGAAIWGGCNWGGGGVYINHNRYNNFNRSNIGSGNGNWGHNVDHRKGVAYGNDKAAQKFNRGGDRQAAQSREQFRARADAGRSQLSSMDRSQLQNRGSAADRAGGGNRMGSSNLGNNRPSASVGSRDVGSRSSSGFSGANYGSSSREASSRGSSSRSSMSSGSRGGGGGRGGGGRR